MKIFFREQKRWQKGKSTAYSLYSGLRGCFYSFFRLLALSPVWVFQLIRSFVMGKNRMVVLSRKYLRMNRNVSMHQEIIKPLIQVISCMMQSLFSAHHGSFFLLALRLPNDAFVKRPSMKAKRQWKTRSLLSTGFTWQRFASVRIVSEFFREFSTVSAPRNCGRKIRGEADCRYCLWL